MDVSAMLVETTILREPGGARRKIACWSCVESCEWSAWMTLRPSRTSDILNFSTVAVISARPVTNTRMAPSSSSLTDSKQWRAQASLFRVKMASTTRTIKE